MQMAWLSPIERGEKILHLRSSPSDRFTPYTHSGWSKIRKPDYKIPGGSKGYSTWQYGIKQGFEIVTEGQIKGECDAA